MSGRDDCGYVEWAAANVIIAAFLAELRPDLSAEAHDHNAAAIQARLAAHDPPLLVVSYDKLEPEPEGEGGRGMLVRLPDGSWVDPSFVRLIISDGGGPVTPGSQFVIPAQVNVFVGVPDGRGKDRCVVIECRDGVESRLMADEIGASLNARADAAAVAREREACARVADRHAEVTPDESQKWVSRHIAEAIRARGQS